jgi:UDP-N-acetylmuramoyl-tripeptide--D-alanyl-D-alanine ligase
VIARPLSEVAEAVRGNLNGADALVSSVATDSRLVRSGGVFVALRGEHADGHDFVPDAFARGAVGAVVARPADGTTVTVADTGRALLDLGADERRRSMRIGMIGVTGANGKTSTKDLAAAVLSARFQTHASPASFNNEIGLPMTLLGAPEGTELVVAEMGARRAGDVALLCEIARPDTVVVTNVGVAHMEIFGSWEEIVRAGAEPVEWLGRDGVLIANVDDPVVRGYASKAEARVVTFGLDRRAEVRAEEVEIGPDARASFVLVHDGDREPVELGVPGEHMVANALAAASCGISRGMPAAECAVALKGAHVSAMRMERFVTAAGVVVLNDAYNANPESMAAALKTARRMATVGRLVAVLGHMAELGPISSQEHERVGELVVRIGVDRLVTVGEPARAIALSAVREGQLPEDVASYDDPRAAADDVRGWAHEGDVVLVKGSRVVALERVAEALR